MFLNNISPIFTVQTKRILANLKNLLIMKTLKRITPLVIIAAQIMTLALVKDNFAATVVVGLGLFFTACYFLAIED